MLETSNLALSPHANVVSENIPFSTEALLILLMSAFFVKAFYYKIIKYFLAKIVPLLKAML